MTMECRSNFYVDGVSVATYEMGQPTSDVAIVFVHGNSSSCQTFERQFAALADYFLIGIDLPGHGKSKDAESPQSYCLPRYANVVRGLVDSIPARRVLFVGWSLG